MSKNNQRNLSEINLGNQTYDRGFADGMASRPKSIKKTHRHAHRYHVGYRHGLESLGRSYTQGQSFSDGDGVYKTVHGEGAKVLKSSVVNMRWWTRLLAWFRS